MYWPLSDELRMSYNVSTTLSEQHIAHCIFATYCSLLVLTSYSWDIPSTLANAIWQPWVFAKWDTLESLKILLNSIQSKTMLDFTICSASNDLNWGKMT